jgi:hypothetical protein
VLRDERWERGDRLTEQIVIGTPGKIVSLLNMKARAAHFLIMTRATPALSAGRGAEGQGGMPAAALGHSLPTHLVARAASPSAAVRASRPPAARAPTCRPRARAGARRLDN